jgi:hypothetical protein
MQSRRAQRVQGGSTIGHDLIVLPTDRPIGDRVLTVAPLVVIGTRQADGTYDLAPKHMAMPLGWENSYGFVCSPRHATYHTARREGQTNDREEPTHAKPWWTC